MTAATPCTQPQFASAVFDDVPSPDYADVSIEVLPPGATTDPAEWARTIFSIRSMPKWIAAALMLRQLVVPLLGIPRAPRDAFSVSRVSGEEAVIALDDAHLDFRVGVGVDADRRLVRVLTAVRLKGWRGRVYFAPVRVAHPLITHAMLRAAARALDPERAASPRRRDRSTARRTSRGTP